MNHTKLKFYLHNVKKPHLYIPIGVLIIVFGVTFALFSPYFTHLVHASFGTWGDTSLINACEDSRGIVALVSPGTNCNAGETEVTWLKDVDAGSGLSITRSSSGATLSLANNDGWMSSNDTWTYASGNSFTISGSDRTSVYTKGTRIKATNNSTTFYGVVISSSYSSGTTTVTLGANNDYSLANSSITSPYYSYEANPQGYPGWFNYTPTYGGFSTSPGTLVAKFDIIGTMCTIEIQPDSGGTSNSTSFTVSLPVSPADTINNAASILAYDNGSNQLYPGIAQTIANSTTLNLYKNFQQGGWTASGVKSTSFTLTYAF